MLKTLWTHHRGELLFFITGLIAVHFALFSGTFGPGFRNKLDSTKASEFGQFVGGYVGTIFVIASVALLIASFRNQRAASELSAFENRFFELLKYHRENASEISIGERTGRKVFVPLIRKSSRAGRREREIASRKKGKWGRIYIFDILTATNSTSTSSSGKTSRSTRAPTFLDWINPECPASLDTLQVSAPPAVKLAAASARP